MLLLFGEGRGEQGLVPLARLWVERGSGLHELSEPNHLGLERERLVRLLALGPVGLDHLSVGGLGALGSDLQRRLRGGGGA